MGVILLPQGSTLMASSTALPKEYSAYPKPLGKPYECVSSSMVKEEQYIDKKQALAAMVGLYFGVKHATAPQEIQKESVAELCV